ncbi:TRAP-type mannitol/chloroaromatic compound transport system, periplasmic component [Acidovorax sp. CF316]|uniref:TRAP transporter substrate-binding protein n=1 Tax=Acidovorax sp. CF316 TaxID=1144317 RepID=UPI00026BD34A|nr:TRAP transporter substrate-binding protein DctP [Acidovorax sp. CF316]EJE53359.1 TRAP-type mannitol/chloroaromatic compound transport system, periplasmic component [Acidovorax sp. CF316]
MNRRSLIKGGGIFGLLAAGVAPAIHAQAAIRWRLASSFPKSLDTVFGTSELFAKKVGEMTGGKFQISVHAGGELMPAFSVVDGVQTGSVQMAHSAGYYFYGKDPAFCLGSSVPFGMNARQINAWMYEGNGLKLMREFYARYNIYNLPGGNTGAQMGGWFRKEIKSVADLKGLKFRTNPFAGKVLEPFGLIPQSLPAADLYPALEKGTIDALEWVGPYDDQKLGFNKIAPFYYYPGWWEGGPHVDFYINTKAWDDLSAEYKAVVEAAASHAHVSMLAKYDARNPTALKQLVGSGTKLRPFTHDVMSAAFKSAQQLYADLNNSNPEWKKIYTDYSKFLADQNVWFRFAEGTFDRFMQQQQL